MLLYILNIERGIHIHLSYNIRNNISKLIGCYILEIHIFPFFGDVNIHLVQHLTFNLFKLLQSKCGLKSLYNKESMLQNWVWSSCQMDKNIHLCIYTNKYVQTYKNIFKYKHL